jgi:hypothetical protein
MAAQERPGRRTTFHPPARQPIRCSVPLDVLTHAKLRALATLRGVDGQELAATLIRAGLQHVVIQERGGDDPGGPAGESAGL